MGNIIIPNDLDKRITTAATFFWATRSGQKTRQDQIGTHDQGNRGAVTGGKQLDGFVTLIKDILILNGVHEDCIFTNSGLELPGFYRPTKKWDLLVVHNKELIIAIEFKSQVGPSFGNNFNNRTEEAMGSALDIWTAYREGAFGAQQAPWLGYFMVLEDCQESNDPVSVQTPHFPVFPEFKSASYLKRYEIFCQKLLLERQYNAACFAATSISSDGIHCSFPKEQLSCKEFVTSMLYATLRHFYKEQ